MTELTSVDQIKERVSQNRTFIIFKHSTRCSISSVAWNRVKGKLDAIESQVGELLYLDLIRYREISNYVADFFQVWHESPQILIIQGSECVYNGSHLEIRPDEILNLKLPLNNN